MKHSGGLLVTNLYDANGRLSSLIEKDGSTALATNSYTWTNGLVHTHADALGLAITNSYDALGRLTNTAFPGLTSIRQVYTNLDLAMVVDRMGFTNSYQYDALRRRTRVTDPRGHSTAYAYCDCGALTSVSNAVGEITQYFYASRS